MQFLKKLLGKIGKKDIAKKVADSAGEINYGKFPDGHKIPKNMARQLPEGDFRKASDHPIFSKDNTKKFRDSKQSALERRMKDKVAKYGIPVAGGVILGGIMNSTTSGPIKVKIDDEKKKSRPWQR